MKRTFPFVWALIALATVMPAVAGDQNVLTPLLIDLSGWQAEKPEAMSMDMGGMKMTSASRTYAKGDASVTVMLMVGNSGMAQGPFAAGSMETGDAKVKMKTIDGFNTSHGYDKTDGTGGFMVFLDQKGQSSGLLAVNYDGISMQEAENIAKKFDWKKMKATVQPLL